MTTIALGIDCTAESYSVGLWSSAGTSLELSGHQPRRALRELPGAASTLLAMAGLGAGDLSVVGVTEGPGSFTGVRLGVTVAKTIAFVANCPVCGWDTLELLARQQLPEGSLGRAAVALDARRGELYCAVFQRTEAFETRVATAVATPAEFAAVLEDGRELSVAVGSGFEAYPDLLPPQWCGAKLVSRQLSAPSGLEVARLSALAQQRWQPAATLEPVYHRRADIQVSSGPA